MIVKDYVVLRRGESVWYQLEIEAEHSDELPVDEFFGVDAKCRFVDGVWFVDVDVEHVGKYKEVLGVV